MLNRLLKFFGILFLGALGQFVLMLGGLLTLLVILVITGMNNGGLKEWQDSESAFAVLDGEYTEGAGVILEVPIAGIIMRDLPSGSIFDEPGAYETVVDALAKAEDDDEVKAVLFRVNSPGGSVSASDHLHHLVSVFQKKTGKPVAAYFEGVSASGAVYATASCNLILAEPSCLTGSIGVIMTRMSLVGLFGKLGIESQPFKSGEFKDMGSGSREISQEETALFQGMVDSLFDRFVQVVDEGRGDKISREKIVSLKGQFFLADKAMEMGLLDGLCFSEEAYDIVRQELNLLNMPVVRFKGEAGLQRLLKKLDVTHASTMDRWLATLLTQSPMYLAPELLNY